MISALRPGRLVPAALLFAATPCAAPVAAAEPGRPDNPMRFFEGRTESKGLVRLFAKKNFHSRAIGRGEIRPDGTLHLVQKVDDEGEAPRTRVWRIRRVGPARFEGTMNEAKGPVTVEEVAGKFRFRFKLKGHVDVEQWLIPDPGWKSAKTKLTIRKFGVVVGRSDGTIRKLD